ncbi:MAG: hypothetical protein BWK76_23690 [Desulfobulbaceae bacterium A2]|nr:MAG: hypothetical protein BWK76_23690 [Desulfobulbaceae bacterium A2]
MRLALLADIHANLEALRACLTHAAGQGVDRYVILGDIVGYNADPVACLEIVAGMYAKSAVVLRGNHDTACLGGMLESMNFLAREAIYWTRTQLGAAERAFLEQLPQSAVEENCLFSHASPAQPELWRYITGPREAGLALAAAKQTLLFVGHVHRSVLFFNGGTGLPRPFVPTPEINIPLSSLRRWICIIGAVGQPRDHLNAATYAILDLRQPSLIIHRVPYDCHSAARKVRAAGLPERLARRLEKNL